ncbi:MAG TPA: fatty acid desaturase family protein [Gemmatimonadaceae bacterium]|nr:fatty acid desaturase family protein [Gemmatimonadaceae bacterium]
MGDVIARAFDVTNEPFSARTARAARDPYAKYRASLLTPERVRELSSLRPARVIVDTLGCWLVIVAAWALVAVHPTWWTVAIAIPLIGTRYYALFIIGHDGLHRRLFRSRSKNDWFNDLLIMGPIGAITRLNNKNHLLHHQHLATDEDPDRHKHACFNKANLPGLLVFLSGLYSVITSIRHVFFAGPADKTVAESGGDGRYTLRDAAVLLGWQGLLIAGLTMLIGWWAYPVLWLLPVYAFMALGDNFRSFAEHSHPESDEEADEHRLVTYLSTPLERMLVAPMNMNYHAAHHLWVSIPYYNLPAADSEIRWKPGTEGMEWRGSYVGYLWRYARALPLEECAARPSSAQ